MSLAKEPSLPDTGSLSFFRRAERERVEPVPGLVAGKVVGDFRLVSLLGQGGMGQVWEAAQMSLGNRVVAVKFVRPERVTSHQLELFAREARAGGRLSHSGIVGVHGHGESDGLAWIAMELVSGAWTLRDFLDDVSRMDEVPAGYDRHVARFTAEIAEAVHAAHEAGVIHRDLKPQNVLVTPDEHPKVTDFGLARITDESALSQTGDFAGTYFYMSPEQVTAKRMGLDHRSDIFSLGIVLYEMLALRRPFEGDTSHQVAAQIVTKDPPDPRTLRSRIPRDLVVIAGKALEKDRDKRYQTMAELAADLRRWLSNEPIHATPPTRVDRALKWTKRNPTKSVATGLVAVALAVISALLVANVLTNRELAQSNDNLQSERTNLARANALLETERSNLAKSNVALKAKTEEAEASAAEALAHKERADELAVRWEMEAVRWETEAVRLKSEYEQLQSGLLQERRNREELVEKVRLIEDHSFGLAAEGMDLILQLIEDSHGADAVAHFEELERDQLFFRPGIGGKDFIADLVHAAADLDEFQAANGTSQPRPELLTRARNSALNAEAKLASFEIGSKAWIGFELDAGSSVDYDRLGRVKSLLDSTRAAINAEFEELQSAGR